MHRGLISFDEERMIAADREMGARNHGIACRGNEIDALCVTYVLLAAV
jgi:hypothetical protein